MSQPQSIEEIMQRIRTQLGLSDGVAGGSKSILHTKDIPVGEIVARIRQNPRSPQPVDGKDASDEPLHISIKLREISHLRTEVQTAREGARQVGQINPRNPGMINNIVQLLKKMMRRLLIWYTRPLQHFQGGVVNALDQISGILESQNDSLHKVATELRNHANAIAQGSDRLAQVEATFQQKASTLELQIGAMLDRNLNGAVKWTELKLSETSLAQEPRINAVMPVERVVLSDAPSPHSQQIARLFGELDSLRSELAKTRAELREVNTRDRSQDRDVGCT